MNNLMFTRLIFAGVKNTLIKRRARYFDYCSAVILGLFMFSCATGKGVNVREAPTGESLAGISGVGIESHDIDRMTVKMVEEILGLSLPSYSDGPPRIIIDSQKLVNESSQVINTSLLTDRLRIALIRNSQGRLFFISRENSDAVIEEALLSDELNLIPADYRLTGRITSIRSFSETTGINANFVQVSFELLDLRTSAIAWADIYEVKKVGADDTIYR